MPSSDAPLLPRGHEIRAFDIGALLATGNDTVLVRRRPRIAVIATGDEIVEPGLRPRAGQVIEFNSRMLAGIVSDAGGATAYLGRAKDDEAALAGRIRDAVKSHELVCVIAGSSKGRKDFTLDALAACGRISFRGIAMAPGRPTGLAVVDGTPVLAVPGYPVSAVVAYRELVVPFIAAALGVSAPRAECANAVVRRDIASRLGVEEMIRVCLASDGEQLVAAPLPRGAGSVSTLVRADGILRIPASREGVSRGSEVAIELLRPRAEVGCAVVVAGMPHGLFATIEDACRRDGETLRFAYLGLSDLDATSALVAGEAHCGLLTTSGADGWAEVRAWLDARAPGWQGYEISGHGRGRAMLAIMPSLQRAAPSEAFSRWQRAVKEAGYEVRSIG
jgi:putative molybdopterin biosynthesis protein